MSLPICVLLVLAVGTALAVPSHPTVLPSRFSVVMDMHIRDDNISHHQVLYFDLKSGRTRLDNGRSITVSLYTKSAQYLITPTGYTSSCLKLPLGDQLGQMMLMANDSKFVGEETMRDTKVYHWTTGSGSNEKHYWEDAKTGAPVRFSRYGNYITNYFDFSTSFDDKVFTQPIDERCQDSVTEMFHAWRSSHHRAYATVAEYAQRQKVFQRNHAIVQHHNSLKKSYKLALNQFADMTDDEFRAQYLGFRRSGRRAPAAVVHKHAHVNLPASVDWREKGAVSPVKDQADCGSCWTFATTGSVESAVYLKTGKMNLLSEQQLLDCTWSLGVAACNGGDTQVAYTYVMSHGLNTEADYSYQAENDYCRVDDSLPVTKISSFVNISMGDEQGLTSALASAGPVAIAIDASQPSFRFYASGVYDEPACENAEDKLDHAVLAVGYGTQGGADYYIVKNSWGVWWGDQGYIRMSRNKNNQCGVATDAAYPVA